ncbi:MAG TPA: lipocalin family protein [Pyrinomonadaceae bacterium]|nr:lipocalin family protein [Pyrinomonadaceae bacterium]
MVSRNKATAHSLLIGFFTPVFDLQRIVMTANIFLITVLTFAGFAAVALEGRKDELEVVQSVDLTRYTGRWYEIARLPNSFQKKCTDTVTADYSMRADGKIEVINRCRKASGEYSTAKGKAKIVDKKTNAKLKVTFFWPFYGDYWILDLGPNYEYAVVGEPDRKYLWILSRSPQMDEALYQQLLQKMAAKGFNTEMMIKTSQFTTESGGEATR